MYEKVQTNIKGKTLRSSPSQMFLKVAVLKSFENTIKKTPVLDCIFNKLAGLNACIFIKKRRKHRCFLKNKVFCRTPHRSLYFFAILCNNRTFWTPLSTKLTFFIFLVPLLRFPPWLFSHQNF